MKLVMNRKNIIRTTQIVITAIEFFATKVAFAQQSNLSLPNPLDPNGTGSCTDLTCPLNAIIDFVYVLSFPLCGILVLWAGIQLATSAGNPEKVKTARNTLLYTALGFVVILLAKGAGQTIQKFLGF